ncbi:MAG: hypothetical protein WC773_02085 [Patescibacteria group bacterium]
MKFDNREQIASDFDAKHLIFNDGKDFFSDHNWSDWIDWLNWKLPSPLEEKVGR